MGAIRIVGNTRQGENEMPQLLFIAAVAAVGVMGYRAFVKEAEKVSARVRRAEKEQETGAVGTLVEDRETGEYRVVKPDE